jgi:nitrate reductase NapAB chaperone NapD
VKQGEQQGDANQSNSKKQKTDQSDGISVSIQNPKGKLVAVISSTGSGNITMTN